MLLWPHRDGTPLPQTGWMGDLLQVDDVRLRVAPDDTGRHRISAP
jgi:hypothetical protein